MFSIHSLYLKRSNTLIALLSCMGLVSFGLVFAIDASWLMRSACVLFIALVLCYELHSHCFNGRIHTIIRKHDYRFALISHQTRWEDMQLSSDTIATPFWVILHFRHNTKFWRRKVIFILPDMLPADAHRRLRVYLKHLHKTNHQSIAAAWDE